MPAEVALPQAGSVLVGEKASLLIPHIGMPRLFPTEKAAVAKIEKAAAGNHHLSWADACRGVGATMSNFDYAGVLTETVLLGTIAIRVPDTTLRWDAAELKIAGSPAADALVRKTYRKRWEPAWLS